MAKRRSNPLCKTLGSRLARGLAGLACGSCLLASSDADAAKTIVLAIGNNQGHASEQTLMYAERDAQQVASVFQQYSASTAADTRVLLGKSATDVFSSLDDIKAMIESYDAKDRSTTKVIIYYSGHADGRGLHPGPDILPYDDLRARLQALPIAVKILIVDGCRSGGLTRVKGARQVEPFSIRVDDELNTSGFALISSSTATEVSHESDDLRGSFFTHHFLNGLRGIADFNDDGQVSLDESYAYAYHQTLRSSSQTLSLQHATLERSLRGRGQLTLSTPSRADKTTAKVVLDRPSVYLVSKDERNGSVVAEVETQRRGQSLRLPPGAYRIQQRGRRNYRNYRVSLSAGDVQTLDPERAQVIEYGQLVRKGGAKKSSSNLSASVGVRGPLMGQSRWSPQIGVGYTLHFAHFSLGTRLRAGRGRFEHKGEVQGFETRETEVGLGATIERYIDLRRMSLAFGLWSEGLYLRQSVRSSNREPTRHSFGAAFGGNFSVQYLVSNKVGLRVDAGPATYVFRRANIVDGAQTSSSIHSAFTFLATAGAYLRF